MSPKKSRNENKKERKKIFDWLPTKEQLRHLPKVLSKRERGLILTLIIVGIASLITLPITSFRHYTTPTPDFGGSFTEGLVGTPQHINPLLTQTNDVDRDLSELIYSGLIKYNEQGELEPDLAESFSISDDGLTYTFKLRQDLKWHDGQPITADDVIFTVLVAQDVDRGSPQRRNWQGVDVSKTDGLTVKFVLKNKYAQFISSTTMGILPKHIWENIAAGNFSLTEINLKPAVGSGPYKFSKIKRDSLGKIKVFEVVANEDYYAGKPYISKINFNFYDSEELMINAYNNNEIDSLGSVSPQNLNSVRFLGQLKINKLKLPRYFAIFFNQNQSKVLSDKTVRTALSHSINKDKIIDDVLSGNGIRVDSPMLPGIINIPDNAVRYDFDTQKSEQILNEAGWNYSEENQVRVKGEDDSAVNLEIRLTTSNWPELVSVANLVKEQWEAAGARVRLETLPLPELQQVIKERTYEALLFGEVLGLEPDPFSFWHSSQKRDPGLNLALYDNKDADRLLEEARQALNFTDRMAKYDELQKLITQDIPAIFLYSPDYIYARSANVKNGNGKVVSIPSDRFSMIHKWYIETKRVGK
ncbi:MAG: peptide ABC transporter substrate-binding protein [Candidatus Paceibacterota bacterium]